MQPYTGPISSIRIRRYSTSYAYNICCKLNTKLVRYDVLYICTLNTTYCKLTVFCRFVDCVLHLVAVAYARLDHFVVYCGI